MGITNKQEIILEDFYKTHCKKEHYGINNFLNNKCIEKEYKPSNIIFELYNNYPNKYKIIFATAHDKLNNLLDFMNFKKRSNGHYNANESRELLHLILDIFELQDGLSRAGVLLLIDKKYEIKMKECMLFLTESYGCEIPEKTGYFNITKYDPIFRIKNFSEKNR